MANVTERVLRLAVYLGACLLLAVAPAEGATTFNVSTVAQLEAAINIVNAGTGGDLIVLAAGFYPLTNPLSIDQDVTIQGDPSASTTIDGAGGVILDIRANNVSVQNVTLRNASTAIDYGGSGVFSGTGITITGTTQTGFSPGDSGGSSFFTNSTIVNNANHGIEIACASMTLTNVTVSDNDVGVFIDFPCGEQMSIINSLIVRNNTKDCDGGGSFTAVGDASIDSDGSCVALGFGPGLVTRTVASVVLGAPANNGGPTFTESISPPSVAINTGNNAACPATDQRGFLRNVGACDVGAFEAGAGPVGGNTPTGTNVAVAPTPGVTVTFSQVLVSGDTSAPTGGPLPPSGFQVDGLVYDISTTATVVAPITVCLPYSPTIDPTPTLSHFENVPPPTWVNRTTSVDSVNHIVCGTVSSLSPFAVLAPVGISSQLQQLQVLVNQFNLGRPADKQFTHRLDNAKKAFARQLQHKQNVTPFCAQMSQFTKDVQKQTGKTLASSEASQLLALAGLITSEVGCR